MAVAYRVRAWCGRGTADRREMSADPEQRGAARPHAYDLYEEGRAIGRLEWRARPRMAAGWYLVQAPGPPERLDVDPAIDDLARDQHSADHDWELHAELAAILSTALALDAAERFLHERPDRPGRFRRLDTAQHFEIYVTDVDPSLLAHAVPEMPLMSVSDVYVLEGMLLGDSFQVVVRRIGLLGGRVVAVFRNEPEGD
jgi:hypothetical protein